MPCGTHKSHLRVLGFKARPHTNSSFRLVHAMTGSRCWLKHVGLCHPRGRPGFRSWLLLQSGLSAAGIWGGRNSRREIDTVLSVPLSLSQVKLNFKSSWPKTKQKRQLAVPLGFMSGFHPFHVAVSDFTPVPGYFGGILQLCCSFSAIPTHL